MTTAAPVLTPLQAVRIGAMRAAARNRGHDRYIDDPVGFVGDRLDEHLWSKQREVAEAVRDHRHVAVRSAHDTGKSHIASRLAVWWIESHPPGSAFVVTSAPSFPQVRAILWREINRAHKKGNLQGETNQTEWWLDKEIVAYGRKPADYDEDAFQGIHARYVLVILDEANGIPKTLWTAAETITTNENCRIVGIGNPDDPLTEFKRVCEPGTAWHVIHIDGLDSPNFTDELEHDLEAGKIVPMRFDPKHPRTEHERMEDQVELLRDVLLSPTWVEERRKDWGEDSPVFQSKVRGNFPLVPEGAVYKELALSQQWFGPEPKYHRYVGGLDFGGQNDQAHKTAAVVAGVAVDDSLSEMPRVSKGTTKGILVRKYHFEHSGPRVHDQLIEWMHAVEQRINRRVEWKCDKSQSGFISMAVREGFVIEAADGGPGSVMLGIGLQRRRMEIGSSFFMEDLTRIPVFLAGPKVEDVGKQMAAKSWYERMQNYVWELQPDETKAVKGVPLKRNDDTADADRYMHEAVDAFPMYVGPTLGTRDIITGKKLPTRAV